MTRKITANPLQKLASDAGLFSRRATRLSEELTRFEADICQYARFRFDLGDSEDATLSLEKIGDKWQLMLGVGSDEQKHITELPVEHKLIVYGMREEFLTAYADEMHRRAEELDDVLFPVTDQAEDARGSRV